MARRAANQLETPDALDDVIAQDTQREAENVGELIGSLVGLVTDDAEVIIYKVNDRTGKWAYIKTLKPPLQTEGLMEELRDEWGGGEYNFRVRAKGKIVTTKSTVIAGDQTPKKRTENNSGNGDFMQMFMQMNQQQIAAQERAKSDQMQMMQLMMNQSNNANAMQMQMMQSSSQQMMTLITAMMGNKESPLALMQAMATIQETMGGKKDGLDDFIKAAEFIKSMTPDGGGGGGGSFLEQAAGALMPAVAKIMEGAAVKGVEGAPVTAQQAPMPRSSGPPVRRVPPPLPSQSGMPPPPAFIAGLPGAGIRRPPNPIPGSAPIYKPVQPQNINRDFGKMGLPPPTGVLASVTEDVLFFARRKYDVGLAAEAILTKLDEAGIDENALLPLIIRFNSSPNWMEDLAREGIDLRPYGNWGTELLTELVRQYTTSGEEGNDSQGVGGGASDAGANEEFVA